MVVDAIDVCAIDFYQRFPDNGQRLFLPMSTIAKAFCHPAI